MINGELLAENAGTKITELYETNQQFASDLDSSANRQAKRISGRNGKFGLRLNFSLEQSRPRTKPNWIWPYKIKAEMDLDMLQGHVW